ncbi:hypothetical protein HN51_000252 [Arachis hypogaea]
MSSASPPPSTPAKDANLPQLETYQHFSACVFPQNYVVSGSVMPRYALSVLCEKMDGVGLRNYLFAHFKDRIKVQAELPGALRCAPEPGKMVLEALQGFHGGSGFNDAELKKVRKCCLMLMKQLRIANAWLSSKTREKALEAAREWKERLVAIDSGNTLVALGFLHLVAAFGLVSEFILDELVDCSLGATIHEEFPELCRITGLADRVPDIVQKLINRGKHILAVKYVFEFNLVDKISPVAILKDCVEESKELSKRLTEEGKTLIETTAREIHALKSVIKTIEYHKLESEYPRAIVDQRIEEVRRHKSMIKKKLKMKRRACAQASTAKLLLHQQQHQPQQPQRKMQMQRQQQSEFKRPRTQTPNAVGHSAIQKNNVNEGDLTTHQYQYCCEEPLVHSSVCLFQEHLNPYMNSTAVQFGMVDLSGGPYAIATSIHQPSALPRDIHQPQRADVAEREDAVSDGDWILWLRKKIGGEFYPLVVVVVVTLTPSSAMEQAHILQNHRLF